MEWERRSFAVEMRVVGDKTPKIEGYAAVFEVLSEEMWGFREKIRAGAFKNVLKDDVRALFNHDANFVLGRNRAGTLSLEEDQKGLRIEIDPPDTQAARDLLESIRRGDVSEMSFKFITKTDEWNKEADGTITRTLVELERLLDVSVVTFPAYPQTSVNARCMEEVKKLSANSLQLRNGEDGGASGPESGDGAHEGGTTGAGAVSRAQSLDGVSNGAGAGSRAENNSGEAAGGPVGLSLKRKLLDLLEKA